MFIPIIKKEIKNKTKKHDFGDILEKWEHGAYHSSEITMDNWLQNHKITDKDAEKNEAYLPGEKRRRLLNKKPDDILDIHGQTNEKAWLSLDIFFSNARENNYQKLRIIHGKGNHSKEASTLKSTVRKYIEKCSFAGESGFERAANGGSGATWVLLKD